MTSLTRILTATATVVVGGQLFAQSDTGLTLDEKVLTLSAARKVVAAAEVEATKRGLGVVIVVVDDSGTVIELSRMDAAQIASVNVGMGKARTAAIYRRPSRVFEEQIRDGRVAALALADATPLQGGVPILINSKVVGAVGVSGDSPQVDEEIAIAGAKAVSSTK
jgi:glc operon protein GlcG